MMQQAITCKSAFWESILQIFEYSEMIDDGFEKLEQQQWAAAELPWVYAVTVAGCCELEKEAGPLEDKGRCPIMPGNEISIQSRTCLV